MFGRRELIEYACPTCNAEFGTLPEKAGTGTHCNYCKTEFTIPVGHQPRLVTVSDSPAEEPDDYEELPLVPARRESPRLPVREAPRPVRDGMVPATRRVKMSLPNNCGALDVEVTQETANQMATTFLGGLLVAIGVFLAAMIGIRRKS